MPERLFTMRYGEINQELDVEAWLEWYMSANRCLYQTEIPHGKLVCVFSGIDTADTDPPSLFEVRQVINSPSGVVEETAWTLRTQHEAKAVYDQKLAEAMAA